MNPRKKRSGRKKAEGEKDAVSPTSKTPDQPAAEGSAGGTAELAVEQGSVATADTDAAAPMEVGDQAVERLQSQLFI